MSDRPPSDRDLNREFAEDEEAQADDRPIADWLQAMGPEDMSRERVLENLEEYGFDQLQEDDFVSNPLFPVDMPDWFADSEREDQPPVEIGERITETPQTGGDFRPVEDEVIDDLDEDAGDDETVR